MTFMANIEEKIDKILEHQITQSVNIALIKQSQELHVKDYETVKKSHYQLRDEFKGLKGKIILISGAVGAFFTFVGNWIYKVLTNN